MHIHTFFSFICIWSKFKLAFHQHNWQKIKRGLPIQLKHGSMGNGDMVIAVHPDKAKKWHPLLSEVKG